MKFQFTKKKFTFIMTIMMCSVFSGLMDAQSSFQNASVHMPLPCNCRHRPIPFSCGQQCGFFTDPIDGNRLISMNDISFDLIEDQMVSLKIFDMTGRLIKTLTQERMAEGGYTIEWDQTDEDGYVVNGGIYILKLDASDDFEGSTKIIVVN